MVKSPLFVGIHVFTDGKDVPDKIASDLRLVVLSPSTATVAGWFQQRPRKRRSRS